MWQLPESTAIRWEDECQLECENCYVVFELCSTWKKILVPKRYSNEPPSDRRWDALTIELLELRWTNDCQLIPFCKPLPTFSIFHMKTEIWSFCHAHLSCLGARLYWFSFFRWTSVTFYFSQWNLQEVINELNRE